MPNYRRNFVSGGCYFFTVNLLERQRTLLTDHIDLLRDSVRRVRSQVGRACCLCPTFQIQYATNFGFVHLRIHVEP